MLSPSPIGQPRRRLLLKRQASAASAEQRRPDDGARSDQRASAVVCSWGPRLGAAPSPFQMGKTRSGAELRRLGSLAPSARTKGQQVKAASGPTVTTCCCSAWRRELLPPRQTLTALRTWRLTTMARRRASAQKSSGKQANGSLTTPCHWLDITQTVWIRSASPVMAWPTLARRDTGRWRAQGGGDAIRRKTRASGFAEFWATRVFAPSGRQRARASDRAAKYGGGRADRRLETWVVRKCSRTCENSKKTRGRFREYLDNFGQGCEGNIEQCKAWAVAKKIQPRNQALLVAKGSAGEVILELKMSLDDFYDQSAEMIDSNEFRRARGIRGVEGEIRGPKGQLSQTFENLYDETGRLRHNRTTYEDGSLIDSDF